MTEIQMPPQRDSHGDEEQEFKPDGSSSPGVYVRSGQRSPSELDMLWSGSRPYSKEERSPYMFLAVGIILGLIVATATFFLMFNKPEIQVGEHDFLEPLETDADVAPPIDVSDTSNTNVPGDGDAAIEATMPATPVPTQAAQKPVAKPKPKPVQWSGGGSTQSYKVRSGDTLERIARKYYGSGSPANIEKLRRANGMSNPHALQIGQTLKIPPKG